jgi:GNAT superfamily N-acetyltransferase
MLSVDKRYRRRGIGELDLALGADADQTAKRLVQLAIDQMFKHNAQEVGVPL